MSSDSSFSCVANECKSRSDGGERRVTFYSFPEDEELRRKWVEALKRTDWTPTPESRLCSAHFLDRDIDRSSSPAQIRAGAVPFIFFTNFGKEEEDRVQSDESAGKSKGKSTGAGEKKTDEDLVIEYDIPDPEEPEASPRKNKSATRLEVKDGPAFNHPKEPKKNHTCDECDYKTGYRNALLRHKRTHTGEKPFGCSSCKYRTGDRTNLIAHMRRHTGEKPYSCDQCDYRASHRSTLLTHVRTHTGEKPYACDQCDYKTDHHSHLITHTRTHTGEKPFACELCDYRTGHRPNYIAHMRTHTGIKSYACDICDFRSGQRSNLNRHKKTHTGENTFVCDACDFKTDQRPNFITHLKTHAEKMPYACTICEFRTSQRSNLTRHIKTHSGEKPFKCDTCHYRTGRAADLERHKKTHLSAMLQMGTVPDDALPSILQPHLLAQDSLSLDTHHALANVPNMLSGVALSAAPQVPPDFALS